MRHEGNSVAAGSLRRSSRLPTRDENETFGPRVENALAPPSSCTFVQMRRKRDNLDGNNVGYVPESSIILTQIDAGRIADRGYLVSLSLSLSLCCFFFPPQSECGSVVCAKSGVKFLVRNVLIYRDFTV